MQTGLTSDDIAGIQALYGAVSASPAAPPPTTPALPPAAPPAATPPVQPPAATPPTSGDTTPPSLSIVAPGLTMVSTSSASIAINGTANDNVGVAAVKWTNSTGYSGTASGTTKWSATVPLLVGNNAITIRAYDAAGNSSWRALTVVRR
jgi:hypothetical protein